MVSRVCEEFGCVPSVALRELRRHPELVFDIVGMRAYAQTRHALMTAKDESEAPKGPTADLVMRIEHEIFQERKATHDE